MSKIVQNELSVCCNKPVKRGHKISQGYGKRYCTKCNKECETHSDPEVMIRDWQKDMELASRPEFANRKMTVYWLQQYAAEKERADKLQKEIDYRIWSCKQNKINYIETKNRADQAEEREQKLRQGMEELINNGLLLIPDGENAAIELIDFLYPKEGETK